MSMTRDAPIAQDNLNMTTVSEHPGAPKMPVTSPLAQKAAPTWNTKDLGLRLGVDVASAASAGALTCPLITIIDR